MTAALPFAHLDQRTFRSALLREAIRHLAKDPGPHRAMDLCGHLLKWSGKPEEIVGEDIYATAHVLISTGLFQTSTPHPESTAGILTASTEFCASPALMSFLFDDAAPAAANDDPGEVEP